MNEPNGGKKPAHLVPLHEAVGLVLAHDITEIVPGQKKGPRFCMGHVVTEQDLEQLSRLGKRHLYALEVRPDQMHENEAAERLAGALCGPGVKVAGRPREGKIELAAGIDGLFCLEVERLVKLNMVPDLMCATIHRHTPVEAGQRLAGTRAIPLLIERTHVERACEIASRDGGLLRVRPFRRLQVGVVITGNEVADGLIEDGFAPVITAKTEALGSSILAVRIFPDERIRIADGIREFLRQGAGLIIITGGMSVDPDDISRLAIADAGGRDLVYGAPVLPGAMFLFGILDGVAGEVPVLGVPACALYFRATVLDLLLPRVLAGDRLTRRDLAALAHGGFCLACEDCRFPACGFGRGN